MKSLLRHRSLLGAVVFRDCYVAARYWEPWFSELVLSPFATDRSLCGVRREGHRGSGGLTDVWRSISLRVSSRRGSPDKITTQAVADARDSGAKEDWQRLRGQVGGGIFTEGGPDKILTPSETVFQRLNLPRALEAQFTRNFRVNRGLHGCRHPFTRRFPCKRILQECLHPCKPRFTRKSRVNGISTSV